MAMQTINFITWNVNGLKQNRDQKFQELQNADVVFLQETHIGVADEHILECLNNEWYVSYTKFTSRMGTAILVKKRPHFEQISDEKDNCGTYVVLKCKLGGQLYTLVSVYNHEKDTKTLDKLSRYLQSMTTGLLVIGGDFNTGSQSIYWQRQPNPFKRGDGQHNPQKAALVVWKSSWNLFSWLTSGEERTPQSRILRSTVKLHPG